MNKYLVTLVLIFCLAFALIVSGNEKILPSEAIQKISASLSSPNIASMTIAEIFDLRKDKTKKMLPSVQVSELSLDEALILADIYGWAGKYDDAEKCLNEFINEDASKSRQIHKKLIDVSVNAYRFDKTETLLSGYLEKYQPKTGELDYLMREFGAISVIASFLGKHDFVVRLTHKIAASLDLDQPYLAWSTMFVVTRSSFVDTGRADELSELVSSKLETLNKKIEGLSVEGGEAAQIKQSYQRIRQSFRNCLHQLSLEGKPAPHFNFEKLFNTSAFDLNELRGKVVLLDFWTNWCGPCKASFPKMVKLQEEFGPRGFQIVGLTYLQGSFTDNGISKNDLTAEEEYMLTEDMIKRYKMTWPVGFASKAAVTEDYGVSGFPTLVLVDRKGIVRRIEAGLANEKMVVEYLKKLLDE